MGVRGSPAWEEVSGQLGVGSCGPWQNSEAIRGMKKCEAQTKTGLNTFTGRRLFNKVRVKKKSHSLSPHSLLAGQGPPQLHCTSTIPEPHLVEHNQGVPQARGVCAMWPPSSGNGYTCPLGLNPRVCADQTSPWGWGGVPPGLALGVGCMSLGLTPAGACA